MSSRTLITQTLAYQAAQMGHPCPSLARSVKPAFAASGTDKLPRHGYHRMYDQFLQHLYGRPVRMVEIGVRNGESLSAWQTMFDADKSFLVKMTFLVKFPGEKGPVHYDGGRNFGESETLRRPHFKIIYEKVPPPPPTHLPSLEKTKHAPPFLVFFSLRSRKTDGTETARKTARKRTVEGCREFGDVMF